MNASMVLNPLPPVREHRRSSRRVRTRTAASQGRSQRARGAARDEVVQLIVTAHMSHAAALARHYAGRGIPIEDLEQVAYLALVKAARGYDVERGSDFLSYAIPTIKGELRRHFRDAGWMVRPPRRVQELQSRLWAAEAELAQALQRSPRLCEIASHLGVEVEEAIEALAVNGCFAPDALDTPLGDGENSTTVADRHGVEDAGFAGCEARVMLAPALRRLTARDRKILELRFCRGWSQQEIGAEIGVTQMQVSRLISRILADLRAALADAAS